MKKIYNFFGMYFLPTLLNLYIKTLRIKIHNLPDFNKNFIFIFWHSKMIIGWWLFRNKKFTALVSQSKDGEILSNILSRWKYNLVRGSSSKGGKEALNDILNFPEENSVVMTPDGPRGPAKVIKNGALIISNKKNIPLIPVRINYSKKKILTKSWDNFEIPLPFSFCEVTFGNKFCYSKYLNESDLELFKKSLSEKM